MAEIGRALTRAEALRRAATDQERTRGRVRELITTIEQSGAVALDPTCLPTASAGDGRPPTKAMIAFATSIATRRGLKLPRALKSNSAICRAFLDQYAPPRPSEPGKPEPHTGPRPPSEAMVRYARSLAEQQGVECPPAVIADFTACRAFLDEHSRKAQSAQFQNRTIAPKSRLPAVPGGSSDDRRERTPARKPTAARAKAPRRRTQPRAAVVTTGE